MQGCTLPNIEMKYIYHEKTLVNRQPWHIDSHQSNTFSLVFAFEDFTSIYLADYFDGNYIRGKQRLRLPAGSVLIMDANTLHCGDIFLGECTWTVIRGGKRHLCPHYVARPGNLKGFVSVQL